MQTHKEPKIMNQILGIILQQFNYGKNSFIVLVPVSEFRLLRPEHQSPRQRRQMCRHVEHEILQGEL